MRLRLRPTAPALLALLALPTGAAAACPEPTPVAAWEAHLDTATAAYRALDLEGFRSAMDSAATALPCVAEPITADQALRAHQLQGLRSFVLDDPGRTEQAFLAARRVTPTSRLPDTLIPSEHPVRQRYGALPLDALGEQPVPPPKAGAILLDGAPGGARPTQAPVLFQLQDADARVTHTLYLWPDEPLPAYPRPRSAGKRALLWSGLGLGLAGAAAYGAAWGVRGAYFDLPPGDPDREGLRTTTNALGWTGIGLGGVGATLLVVGLTPDR